MVFAYGISIYRDNQIIGALTATKTIALFMDAGAGKGILGGDTYAYITDSNGSFLMNSQYDIFGQDHVLTQPFFKEGELENTKEKLANYEDVSFSFEYEGNRYYAMLKPLGVNDWYILCVNMLTESSLFVDRNIRVVRMLFLGVILLVMGLLVYGYYMIRKSNKNYNRQHIWIL